MSNQFNLPVLEGAYKVEYEEFLVVKLDSYSLQYHIAWPSGMFKDVTLEEAKDELRRYISDEERIEDIMRYATNWKRTVLFPHQGRPGLGLQYFMYENGTIMYGGAGNSFEGHNPFQGMDQ